MIWIHTEVVKSLGPLEYIINCPSHHRVHHARNRKYIDKNYGACLIIWDRLFNTYMDEDPDEPPVYGLVHPIESYNIFYIQFHTYIYMFKSMINAKSWKIKLMIPWMGPGWTEGKPRLGYYDDIPELKQPIDYWDPQIHILKKFYVILHFAVIVLFHHELSIRCEILPQWTVVLGITCILTSLTSIGLILENKYVQKIYHFFCCILSQQNKNKMTLF